MSAASPKPSAVTPPDREPDLWSLIAGPSTQAAILVLIAACYGLWILAAVQSTRHGVALGGAPLFYDFEAFYEAGCFGLHGDAAAAYDDVRMVAAEHAAFPGMTLRLPWNYPPTLQLLVTPLALLPYPVAWLAWSAIGYGGFVLGMRQLHGRRPPVLMLVAPAAAVNLFFGQNGLLTAALICGGVGWLDRRPRLAGVLLGLLCCKPHLAPLPLLLLVADRRWRALGAAVASQALLSAGALLVFGAPTWLAFAARLLHPASVFSSSSSDWRTIPSTMIMARTLGLAPLAASITHWGVAAAAAATALWIWARSRAAGLRAAAVGAAALLISPYLRAYDTALLTPAALWLVRPRAAARPPQRAVSLMASSAAWLAPAVLMLSAGQIQYGPLASILCLGAVVWCSGTELAGTCGTGRASPKR